MFITYQEWVCIIYSVNVMKQSGETPHMETCNVTDVSESFSVILALADCIVSTTLTNVPWTKTSPHTGLPPLHAGGHVYKLPPIVDSECLVS